MSDWSRGYYVWVKKIITEKLEFEIIPETSSAMRYFHPDFQSQKAIENLNSKQSIGRVTW